MTRGKDELTFEDIGNIEEMKANPFAHRICELFSEDGSGRLTFDKFLNMMDAFSDDTPSEVKLVWAFAMWDYDGDGVIGSGMNCLCLEVQKLEPFLVTSFLL